MKKILSLISISIAAFGCTIAERPELPEDRVTDVKIIVTPGEEQNTFLLRTNRTDVIAYWDLGNGNTASGVNEVLAEYPFPGNYTVSLKAYGSNGRTNDVSVKIAVTQENLFLLNDPMYTYIAGEIGSEGKTWMIDAAREYHLELLNPNNPSDRWWGWDAPYYKASADIYDDRATFILNSEKGQAFEFVNNGKSYVLDKQSVLDELYNDGAWGATSSANWVISCTPPRNMGWSLSQSGGRYYISFPNTSAGHGGFLFYFCGWATTYEVRAVSQTHMKLFLRSTVDGAVSLRSLYLKTEDAPDNAPLEWLWSIE